MGLNGNGEDGELRKIDGGRRVSSPNGTHNKVLSSGKDWKKLRVVDNHILGYKLHSHSHTLHPAPRYVKVWLFGGRGSGSGGSSSWEPGQRTPLLPTHVEALLLVTCSLLQCLIDSLLTFLRAPGSANCIIKSAA